MRHHALLWSVGLTILGASLVGCAPPAESPDEEAEAPAESAAAAESAEATPETTEISEAASAQTFDVGDSALLEGTEPEGWRLSTPVEHYEVETLYNKIDGRSEMYMSYNVRELTWSDFVNDDLPGRFINVFVYDMRTASGAFGVFAAEREMDQEGADLGREGYTTDGNYYFWKGKYYAYVQSSHDDEAGLAASYHTAKALDARLADNGEQIEGIDWLPTDGLIEDSITYFLVDAMSLDFMTDTFTARYEFGLDTKPVCFVSKRESGEDATALFKEYVGYLEDYGMSTETLTEGETEIVLGDLGGGYYDGGFVSGDTVAGISAVKGQETAVAAIKAFAARVAE